MNESQFTRLDQQKVFLSNKFLIFKFYFNELEQFYSSSRSSSEELFFRVRLQVRVRQKDRVLSSSSSHPYREHQLGWRTQERKVPFHNSQKWAPHYPTGMTRWMNGFTVLPQIKNENLLGSHFGDMLPFDYQTSVTAIKRGAFLKNIA